MLVDTIYNIIDTSSCIYEPDETNLYLASIIQSKQKYKTKSKNQLTDDIPANYSYLHLSSMQRTESMQDFNYLETEELSDYELVQCSHTVSEIIDEFDSEHEFKRLSEQYSTKLEGQKTAILCEARRLVSLMKMERYYNEIVSTVISDVRAQDARYGNMCYLDSMSSDAIPDNSSHLNGISSMDYSSASEKIEDNKQKLLTPTHEPKKKLNVIGSGVYENENKAKTRSLDPNDLDDSYIASNPVVHTDSTYHTKKLGTKDSKPNNDIKNSTPIHSKFGSYDVNKNNSNYSKTKNYKHEKSSNGDFHQSASDTSVYENKRHGGVMSNVHNKQYGQAATNSNYISHGQMNSGNLLLESRNKLDCFRSNPAAYSNNSLQDIVGSIVEFSKDQHGSRFIQQRMEKSNSGAELNVVFKEIVDDDENPALYTLITDVFGNYVVQKMLEYGTQQHRVRICQHLRGKVLDLTTQMYGCRVIQKAVECVSDESKKEIISELERHVISCVKDQNGNHVIQKCIEHVSPKELDFIIKEFEGKVFELSSHPYGCRVIQRLMEYCESSQTVNLMAEIVNNLSDLVKDQYGNYVIQHILDNGKHIAYPSKIIDYVFQNIFQLSSHKFASNVAEKCIQAATVLQKEALVRNILRNNTGNNGDNVYLMMKDQYANYVIQKIVDSVTGDLRKQLLGKMTPHFLSLKKLTYGKHMINKVDRWVKEVEPCTPLFKSDEDFPPLEGNRM